MFTRHASLIMVRTLAAATRLDLRHPYVALGCWGPLPLAFLWLKGGGSSLAMISIGNGFKTAHRNTMQLLFQLDGKWTHQIFCERQRPHRLSGGGMS